MTRLPRITAAQIINILEKKRFKLSRQSGSHKIYRDDQGRRVTVPYHAGKVLHPKVLKSILSDSEISEEDLLEDI
jgi:predicted RNA binding protein YcfA (HicA-like mRNA interferase family)